MTTYTADSPPPCPDCGGQLTERTEPNSGDVDDLLYAYRCPGCGWEDAGGYDYRRLTIADAPWARDLWALGEKERADLTRAWECVGEERARAEIAEEERDPLRAALADVLDRITQPGHPGEPCLRTGWIPVAQVDTWRTLIASTAPADAAPRPSAVRLTVTPATMRRAEALGFEPGSGDVLLWALDRAAGWQDDYLRACAVATALHNTVTERAAERDALAAKVAACDAAADHVAICPDCGEVETCDEDRCCSCGRDLLVFADRYSAELYQEGQQEHADQLATLRMRIADLHEVLCSDADDATLRRAVAGLCMTTAEED